MTRKKPSKMFLLYLCISLNSETNVFVPEHYDEKGIKHATKMFLYTYSSRNYDIQNKSRLPWPKHLRRRDMVETTHKHCTISNLVT